MLRTGRRASLCRRTAASPTSTRGMRRRPSGSQPDRRIPNIVVDRLGRRVCLGETGTSAKGSLFFVEKSLFKQFLAVQAVAGPGYSSQTLTVYLFVAVLALAIFVVIYPQQCLVYEG